MNLFNHIFAEAMSFYRRNIWLTGLCVIILLFTTGMAYFHGIGGVCYDLFFVFLLCGITMFFRLGCNKRALFDIEDMFMCLIHVLLMSLRYYLADNEFYTISKRQQYTALLWRLLLCGVFIGASVYFSSRMDNFHETGLHPVIAILWLTVCLFGNILVSAFLERKHKSLYGNV